MRFWNRKAKGYTPPSQFREWVSRCHRFMLTTYDPEWDHFVRVALSLGMVRAGYYSAEPDPQWVSECHVVLGDEQVWVGNYPYAYGMPMGERKRPSYATIKLLKHHVDRVVREAKKGTN